MYVCMYVCMQMEEFLDSDAENANYLKNFLSKLFDRSQKVKVLMVGKLNVSSELPTFRCIFQYM